jgi:hypothetical protein
MMDLDEITGNAIDQGKGRWCSILSPWTGEPTGIRMLIAGPDSDVQRRSEVSFYDELADATGADGKVSAEARAVARFNMLSRCVLSWEIEEGGKAVPFRHGNVVRVLRAARWIEIQVDAFAGDRSKFAPEE